jgi:homoserine dehydrogenase
MTELTIAVAGLGTVGAETVAILQRHAGMLAKRCGKELKLVAVSARSKGRDRGVDLSAYRWCDDPVACADEADLIVELMGGDSGPAYDLVKTALLAGKSVVTANKALIAKHGAQLAQIAEDKGGILRFEAAVAGGIPVIDAISHGLSANRFSRIAGILNGTANYILTTMDKEGRDFDDVLKEAQDKGYAEADPGFDIDGVDAAHKLAILTSLAFGVKPDFDAIHLEGIRHITRRDSAYAAELGYVVKLLGITEETDEGIRQRVHPCLVAKNSPVARIDGAFNAVQCEGDAVGRVLLEGPGAGAGPTASAVVSDILQVARGNALPPFIVPVAECKSGQSTGMDSLISRYYLRLSVLDQPGVLAQITSVFAEEAISVQALIQHDAAAGTPADIVMTTHDTSEAAMQRAVKAITAMQAVCAEPQLIRIETV